MNELQAGFRTSAEQPMKNPRNLSPDLLQELRNLARDSESEKSGVSPGEHTVSLYEVLARVHGPKIIPQIDSIMASIVRTLHSSAGSLPLLQACSKVAPAIARYAIDPSAAGDDKAAIVRSLCKPLSDVLMNSSESVASGAALCLKGLVESDNWRFASDEVVNEVCLRVSSAMEESSSQTNALIGLAIALFKQNTFILEAYSRSLLRSGLRMAEANSLEANSLRFSAIQMVNFLIKCVDSRGIFSEMESVVGVMEKLNEDPVVFIRGAAFECLETAKKVIEQEKLRLIEPVTPYSARRVRFSSPESISVNSFLPSSLQSAAPDQRSRIDQHRGVDLSLRYEIFSGLEEQSKALHDDSIHHQSPASEFRRSRRRKWTDHHYSVDLSLQRRIFSESKEESNASPDDSIHLQQSGPRIPLKNMNLFVTPRRLMRSIQDPVDNQSDTATWHPPQDGTTPLTINNEEEYSESISSCGEICDEVDEERESFEDVPFRKRNFFRLCLTLIISLLSIMATISMMVDQIFSDGHGVVPT